MTQWGLDTLFNPAKRHMDEEKRRLQSTREEVGDNSGGRRIDLESGKVVIRRADEDDEQADEHVEPGPDASDENVQAANVKPANAKTAKAKPAAGSAAEDKPAGKPAAKDKPAPSAAAQRAAARRGRTAR